MTQNNNGQNEQPKPRRVIVPNKDLGVDWHKKGQKEAPKDKK